MPRAIITIDFGSYALQTLERAWITNVQIEAARVALTRNMKRKGKLWIRIFPDKSVTARPPETRMGKGKGAPEYWVAVVKPGNIPVRARRSFRDGCARIAAPRRHQAGRPHPLYHPRRTILSFMKIVDVRNLTDSELVSKKKDARQEYFNLRLQQQTGALEKPSRLNELRKDVAKLETVLSERRLGLKVKSRVAKKKTAEKKK